MQPIDNLNNFDEEPPEAFTDLPLGELGYIGEIYEEYYPASNQKRELRIDWNPYEEFSAAFLDKHYELVLLNIFTTLWLFFCFPPIVLAKNAVFVTGGGKRQSFL